MGSATGPAAGEKRGRVVSRANEGLVTKTPDGVWPNESAKEIGIAALGLTKNMAKPGGVCSLTGELRKAWLRGVRWKGFRPLDIGVSRDLRERGVLWELTKLAGWARATEDMSGSRGFAHRLVDAASISDSKAAEAVVHVNGTGLVRVELWLMRWRAFTSKGNNKDMGAGVGRLVGLGLSLK